MIIDNNLIVSGGISGDAVRGQAVVGTNTSVVSTNVIDLLKNRDIAEGETIQLQAQVTKAVVGATSIEIQAVAADNAEMTTNVTVVGSTGPVPVASLTTGARFKANLNPRIGSIGRRYLAARYVITGAGTAGEVITHLGIGGQDGMKFYPSGF